MRPAADQSPTLARLSGSSSVSSWRTMPPCGQVRNQHGGHTAQLLGYLASDPGHPLRHVGSLETNRTAHWLVSVSAPMNRLCHRADLGPWRRLRHSAHWRIPILHHASRRDISVSAWQFVSRGHSCGDGGLHSTRRPFVPS